MLGDPLDDTPAERISRGNEHRILRDDIYTLGTLGISFAPFILITFSFHLQRVFIRKNLYKLTRLTASYIR